MIGQRRKWLLGMAMVVAVAPPLPVVAGEDRGDQPAGGCPAEAVSPAPWPERPDFEAADGFAIGMARFPASATMIRGAMARALANDDAAAIADLAERLAKMGGALGEPSIEAIAPLLPEAGREDLIRRLRDNRSPLTASSVAATAPADIRLIEGIAFEPGADRYFLASVVSGGVYRMPAGDNAAAPLESEGAGSRYAMALDATNRRLWVAAGDGAFHAGQTDEFRGLIAFDADSGVEQVRVTASEGEAFAPGDIALLTNGDVVASDPQTGAVWRYAVETGTLAKLVEPGVLRSPQGLAPSPDNAYVYIADYAYGLARVTLATGAVEQVASDGTTMLDGLDGLYRHGDDLIAIQNGSNPQRIVRLRLDPAGGMLCGLDVLERAVPEWNEPTQGVIVAGELRYVAQSQWPIYREGGEIAEGAAPGSTEIRGLPLDR